MNNKFVIDSRLVKHCGGSWLACAIFSQCYHYQFRCNRAKPFYKFTAPCKHKLYKKGDSWIEELCCTEREFRHAISKIAYRVGIGDPSQKEKALVWIRYEKYHPSTYEINIERIHEMEIHKWLSVTSPV